MFVGDKEESSLEIAISVLIKVRDRARGDRGGKRGHGGAPGGR